MSDTTTDTALDLIDEVVAHIGPLDAKRIARYVKRGDIETAWHLAYSLRRMFWQEDICQYSYDLQEDEPSYAGQ